MKSNSLRLAMLAVASTACIVAGFQVYGEIGKKYASLGGPTGFLGAPRTDETGTPDGIGRFNHFEHGSIYWTPQTQAHEVHGAIHDKWAATGFERGPGYPITDETSTPDGRGRFNHFHALYLPGQPESSIYWTPKFGAFLVYGAIHKAWADAGWERSIGFPTSDEFQWGKYRRSNFERGYIKWASDEGARLVPYTR